MCALAPETRGARSHSNGSGCSSNFSNYNPGASQSRLHHINVNNGLLPNQVWQIYEDVGWLPKTEEKKDLKLSWPIMVV